MKNGHSEILIAEWIPSLNKGELVILIGMIRTFDLLDDYELAAFSFAPHLDSERYPKKVRIVDVGRDLHLGQNILDKNMISFRNSFSFQCTYLIHKKTAMWVKPPLHSRNCSAES